MNLKQWLNLIFFKKIFNPPWASALIIVVILIIIINFLLLTVMMKCIVEKSKKKVRCDGHHRFSLTLPFESKRSSVFLTLGEPEVFHLHFFLFLFHPLSSVQQSPKSLWNGLKF